MEQRIFTQLDALERGARGANDGVMHARDAYNDSSAEFSAHDAYDQNEYGQESYGEAPYGVGQAEQEFVSQPMQLDSFDERLLRQPDLDSRQGQAALGRARLSLPRAPTHDTDYVASQAFPHGPQMDVVRREMIEPRRFDLSQFTYGVGRPGQTNSSDPFEHPLPSSPAFKASQRRPAHDTRPVEPAGDVYGYSNTPASRSYHPQMIEPDTEERVDEQERYQRTSAHPAESFHPKYAQAPARPTSTHRKTPTPVVMGITIVSTHDLPDRFRSIFPFPIFNAVQSKCFHSIYDTNDNFVLSSPTGSGKTAVLELAICRLVKGFASGSYKIVYMAPTKSLCAERQRDWSAKFAHLDLQCAELTGDTDNAQLRNVQHASIIITTPEKWDSMTRKWKDLMQLVKLFLIDEVHILKEDRGATLEAVVSRMKSIDSNVRFVALSATVPNSQDIATWLGKDPVTSEVPAPRQKFGEEFRPVKLTKHVCGYQSSGNDFAFEKHLNSKLPDIIAKYSQHKSIMIFCFTRRACVETAKMLATWWSTQGPRDRFWAAPPGRIQVVDKDLKDTVLSGVAFHHAGLSIQDRNAVERGYLEGSVNVICCTATLAVGVNLPCHMVIIKNTVTYNTAAGGCTEYSDLEIMQMLGRAGRPQFDDSAVAVIMTRLNRREFYEKMVSGKEVLESCLHLNLIEHLNAEVGLGTINNLSSAKKWLAGTFLYVRLKENPEHYKVEGDAPGRTLDERLENICSRGIALLEANDLVMSSPKLRSTEFGDSMARYYIQFATMGIFLAMPPKAKLSEILSAISEAAEFKEVRFRAGEKSVYKVLNKNCSIKFPIPVNIDLPVHKISLIIQSVLGGVDLDTEDSKHRQEFTTARAIIFQNVHRLVRCIIDCQIYLEDSVTVRNALMLARSFGAQVWDDSPLHLKQLEGVGLVSVRKLVAAGIKIIDDIESSEAHQIERALSRNPPYGAQLQEKAKAFPKLRIGLKMMGEPNVKRGEHVSVKIKAEIGFINERVPENYQKKAVYVCMLAETSDGHVIHFCRISAKKLNKGQEVFFSANLVSASQSVRCYVMCDEIAGTMRHATLNPDILASAFPPSKPAAEQFRPRPTSPNAPNTSKPRVKAAAVETPDEFGDAELDDLDLVRAEAGGFVDIDEFEDLAGTTKHLGPVQNQRKRKASENADAAEHWEPRQLANGKWACKHPCKDKTACKHLCCKDGLDKKPAPPKAKTNVTGTQLIPLAGPKQTQLNMSVTKKHGSSHSHGPPANQTETVRERQKQEHSLKNQRREVRELNRLHHSTQKTVNSVPMIRSKPTGRTFTKGTQSALSFLKAARDVEDGGSSDYGDEVWTASDLPNAGHNAGHSVTSNRMRSPSFDHPTQDDDDEMLDAAAADGGTSQRLPEDCVDSPADFSAYRSDYVHDDNAWQYEDWKMPNREDVDDGYAVLTSEPLASPPRADDLDDRGDIRGDDRPSFPKTSRDQTMLRQRDTEDSRNLDQAHPERPANSNQVVAKYPSEFSALKRQKTTHDSLSRPSEDTRVAKAAVPVPFETSIEPTGTEDKKIDEPSKKQDELSESSDNIRDWAAEFLGTDHFEFE